MYCPLPGTLSGSEHITCIQNYLFFVALSMLIHCSSEQPGFPDTSFHPSVWLDAGNTVKHDSPFCSLLSSINY